MTFIGSFCYVALNFFMIYFLTQKVSFGHWNQKEMIVLLGNFYILTYTIFFFFWRGFTYLIRNIRSGVFDYYLLRPTDTQFLVSILGGGVHNLLALIFGIGITIYSVNTLNLSITFLQIIAWIIAMGVSILACYSYIFLLLTLNFKYGYLEEIVNLAFTFQDFSRYPVDAFSRLPIFLLVIAIPFSAMTTIPTMILTDTIFPTTHFLIFVTVSSLFILFVRKVWFLALRNYTSGN